MRISSSFFIPLHTGSGPLERARATVNGALPHGAALTEGASEALGVGQVRGPAAADGVVVGPRGGLDGESGFFLHTLIIACFGPDVKGVRGTGNRTSGHSLAGDLDGPLAGFHVLEEFEVIDLLSSSPDTTGELATVSGQQVVVPGAGGPTLGVGHRHGTVKEHGGQSLDHEVGHEDRSLVVCVESSHPIVDGGEVGVFVFHELIIAYFGRFVKGVGGTGNRTSANIHLA